MSELTFQDPKKKFCEELRAAREYKNLDISRVAERSKISQHYLEKIEAGEWDFLPHAYIRAFMRTYAQIVGMEVGKVLEQFDNIVDEPPVPTPTTPPKEERTRESKPSKKKKTPPPEENKKEFKFTLAAEAVQTPKQPAPKKSISGPGLYWILGFVGIVVVVVAIFFWPNDDSKKSVKEIPFDKVVQEHSDMVNGETKKPARKPAAEKPADRTPKPESHEAVEQPSGGEETPAVASHLPSDEEKQVIPGTANLDLFAEAIGECYIKVTLDNDTIPRTDIVLDSGMTRNFEADSLFTVVLGNAGAMKLKLGGTDLGELGEIGRVVTLRIGREGIISSHKGVLRAPEKKEEPDSTDLTKPVGGARTTGEQPAVMESTRTAVNTPSTTLTPVPAQKDTVKADSTAIDTTKE